MCGTEQEINYASFQSHEVPKIVKLINRERKKKSLFPETEETGNKKFSSVYDVSALCEK